MTRSASSLNFKTVSARSSLSQAQSPSIDNLHISHETKRRYVSMTAVTACLQGEHGVVQTHTQQDRLQEGEKLKNQGYLGKSSITARLPLSVLTLRLFSLCIIDLSCGPLPGFRRDARLERGPAAGPGCRARLQCHVPSALCSTQP